MLEAVPKLMKGYTQPWWVAGGWAIDLFLESESRVHSDIDIAVLRRDQRALREHIARWAPQKVVNGSLVPWSGEETLHLPIHEIHAFLNGEKLEFLLNESKADHWVFRRNTTISLPMPQLTFLSFLGIPVLCPEVVLLYKAKCPTSRDEEDFARVVPKLGNAAREWLGNALNVCHPGHHWLAAITNEKHEG
jgi:hypothetical protein